jgi:hypothetical protein
MRNKNFRHSRVLLAGIQRLTVTHGVTLKLEGNAKTSPASQGGKTLDGRSSKLRPTASFSRQKPAGMTRCCYCGTKLNECTPAVISSPR